MLKKLKNLQFNENQIYLHEKKVEIPKLTPAKWKQLFEKVDMLPGLIVQVLLAPKDDFFTTVITAGQLALDEITEVTALLSGVEAEYIENHVGVDEMVEFLARTVKRNRLDQTAKNLKSLLPSKQGANQSL